MQIELSNNIRLTHAPLEFCRELMEILTFQNPEFLEAQKRGRWTGKIARVLSAFTLEPDGTMIIPRGFIGQLKYLAEKREEEIILTDRRRTLPNVEFHFAGKLRDYQRDAVKDVLSHDFGILSAPTGSGKTAMGLAVIAKRKQPALVIVHTKELLQQWVDRAAQFLAMSPDEIGQTGAGHKRIGKRLTVAIVNSIYPIANEIKDHFGFVIVDECHHCPSRTFAEAVSAFDSRYMLGLSATPQRRDGLARLMFWYLGGLVHRVNQEHLVRQGNIMKPEIVTRRTGFVSSYNLTADYSKGISELTMCGPRNRQIAADVTHYLHEADGPVLILSDRKSHCEILQTMLADLGTPAELLTGDLSNRKRTETVEKIRAGKVKAIVATGSLVGEGFDLPALSALFMATPIKYAGRVTQYVGRVLRPAPGKDRAFIFDYQDQSGVLQASARKRQELYEKNGWTVRSQKGIQ